MALEVSIDELLRRKGMLGSKEICQTAADHEEAFDLEASAVHTCAAFISGLLCWQLQNAV